MAGVLLLLGVMICLYVSLLSGGIIDHKTVLHGQAGSVTC